MNTLFKLPSEFKCPICNSPLYFGAYRNNNNLHMIACNNWSECYSPWRKLPNKIPWHIWINFDINQILKPQLITIEHINKNEEMKRADIAQVIINDLKNTHPNIYIKMISY